MSHMVDRHITGPAARLAGVHVLLVEDDARIASLLATALEYYGAWVTVAPSHRTARMLLRTIVPRVLVVATSPASGDGVPLIRTVRAFERVRGGRTATLALTDDRGESARDTAMMAGFDECLIKPVDPQALCRVVARLARAARIGPDVPDATSPAVRPSATDYS